MNIKQLCTTAALNLLVGTCTALAIARVVHPPLPAVVMPTVALLDGKSGGYGEAEFGIISADRLFYLHADLRLAEHGRTPGVVTFQVGQPFNYEHIELVQYARPKRWSINPAPVVATWKGIGGEAIVTVHARPDGGFSASLQLKNLVLERVGTDERCTLEPISIENVRIGPSGSRGCPGSYLPYCLGG